MAADLMKNAVRKSGRKAYGRHQLRAEINVTPFVDVMLVLLIVFMVSAPLLTVGVPIDLPKTKAATLNANDEPLNLFVDAEGQWFVGDEPVAGEAALLVALTQATQGDTERKIHIRGDKSLEYGSILELMALVSKAGYGKLALVSSPSVPAVSSE